MLEIIIGCGVFILLLILLIIIYHNKFQYVIIKIEEAENNISVLLDNKQELLNRARPIIKKELKLDEFLEELRGSSMLKYAFKVYAQCNHNLKFASEDKFYEIYDEFLNMELVGDNNDS